MLVERSEAHAKEIEMLVRKVSEFRANQTEAKAERTKILSELSHVRAMTEQHVKGAGKGGTISYRELIAWGTAAGAGLGALLQFAGVI